MAFAGVSSIGFSIADARSKMADATLLALSPPGEELGVSGGPDYIGLMWLDAILDLDLG